MNVAALTGTNLGRNRAQVHSPVSQFVEILVDAGDDGAHSQADSQHPPAGVEAFIEIRHLFALYSTERWARDWIQPVPEHGKIWPVTFPTFRALSWVEPWNSLERWKKRVRKASSDEEIVDRVKGGEIALYEIIMRRYNQRLYRVARAVLRDDAEAEDVMQDAYVRAYQHLDQFAGRSLFSTWLTRIALHEALSRLRLRNRNQQFDDTGRDGESSMNNMAESFA